MTPNPDRLAQLELDDILFCIDNADAVDNNDLQKLVKSYDRTRKALKMIAGYCMQRGFKTDVEREMANIAQEALGRVV